MIERNVEDAGLLPEGVIKKHLNLMAGADLSEKNISTIVSEMRFRRWFRPSLNAK